MIPVKKLLKSGLENVMLEKLKELSGPTEKQKALQTIILAIQKPWHLRHIENYGEPKVYLSEHPFIKDYDEPVTFHGFSSDDIYPFLYDFLLGSKSSPRFKFWLCPAEDNPNHHLIYGEIENANFESLIVHGMTDFSGSGGSAYRDLRQVFEFLAEIYDTKIEYNEVESGYYVVVEEEINKQWREQNNVE